MFTETMLLSPHDRSRANRIHGSVMQGEIYREYTCM